MEIEKPIKDPKAEEDSSEDELEDFMATTCTFKFPEEKLNNKTPSSVIVGCLGIGSTIVKSQALSSKLEAGKVTTMIEGVNTVFAEVYFDNVNNAILVVIMKNLGVHLIHNFGKELIGMLNISNSSIVIIDSEYFPFAEVSSKTKLRWIGNQSFIKGNPNVLPLEENFARNNVSADIFQASLFKSNLPLLLFSFQEETEFSIQECKKVLADLNQSFPNIFQTSLDFKETIKEMKSKILRGLYI